VSDVADMAGQRYGHLVVLERYGHSSSGHATWRARCDCGEETIVRGAKLREGRIKSCGCQQQAPRPRTVIPAPPPKPVPSDPLPIPTREPPEVPRGCVRRLISRTGADDTEDALARAVTMPWWPYVIHQMPYSTAAWWIWFVREERT